jgi:acetyltransferase-like isoleucine patch superfamily enzyme
VVVWPQIAGSGHIGIGDKVCFVDNHGCRAQLITYDKQASINIGTGTVIGGTQVFCMHRVNIGARSLLGKATIMDTDVVPCNEPIALGQYRRPTAAPVNIGKNVWLGTLAIVTKGVTLADDSIVGAGSVVFGDTHSEKSLFIGNPARRVGGIF